MNYILNKQSFISLNESLSTARRNYLDTEKVSKKDFDILVKADISKTKKHLERVCKFYTENKVTIDFMEDLLKIYSNLVEKRLIRQNNINNFKNFTEFKDFVEKHEKVTSKTEYKKWVKNNGSKKILDSNQFLIISPKTWEASCLFGKGTQWCTASLYKRDEYFVEYTQQKGIKLYYILNKQLPYENDEYKMAVAVYKDYDGNVDKSDYKSDTAKLRCFNAPDERIPFANVLAYGIDESIFKPLTKEEMEELNITDDPKLNALMIHLRNPNIDAYEIEGRNRFTYKRNEYLVLTDDEADSYATEYMRDDVYTYMGLDDISRSVYNEIVDYIDTDAYIADYIRDERGSVLSGYDGYEHSVEFDGETYYIYKN